MTELETAAAQWPELFIGLTDEQRHSVMNALAGSWHEGWNPNREDTADLTDYVRGTITMDEYKTRSFEKARQTKQR